MKKHRCAEAAMVERRSGYGCEVTMLEQRSGDENDGDDDDDDKGDGGGDAWAREAGRWMWMILGG